MRGKLATALLAVLAAVGIAQAGPAQAFTESCRNQSYGDGALQTRVCFTYFLSVDGTWTMTDAKVWNIPLSQGGHTDCVCSSIRYWNGHMEEPGAATLDGGTYYYGGQALATSQWNTIWLDYAVLYGSSKYCKRVFANPGGGMSAQNITCVN